MARSLAVVKSLIMSSSDSGSSEMSEDVGEEAGAFGAFGVSAVVMLLGRNDSVGVSSTRVGDGGGAAGGGAAGGGAAGGGASGGGGLSTTPSTRAGNTACVDGMTTEGSTGTAGRTGSRGII